MEHNESSKGRYDNLNFTIPKGAKEEAERGLNWVKEFGRGGTSVGRNSAKYILSNSKASPEKVRHIARYFPRHESDKEAEGWRQGENGYPSNGRIAWALWGGEAGKSWSNKLVRAMNRIDEKANSAMELINRREALRKEEWTYRENKFETDEAKNLFYKKFDRLLTEWDFALASEIYRLLDRQRKDINNFFKNNPPNQIGILGAVNSIIDNNVKYWKPDFYDLYLSMAYDFALFQLNELLPEAFKNSEFSDQELEQIRLGRRRKPLATIVQDGFYPLRGRRGVQMPITNLVRNREAIQFVNERLDNILPQLSKTRKEIVNRSLRKAFDEATRLGLHGIQFNDYLTSALNESLTKQLLGNATRIARTEGIAMAEYGKMVGAKKSGLLLEKQWLTQRDGLVRDAHILVDNQRRQMNSPFDVSGYKMDYPADYKYGAPIELIVNCRCTTIYHNKRIKV